jgi:ankyrin repeat protein
MPPSLWNMRSSTVRTLFGGPIAALIIAGATSLAPDPEILRPAPAVAAVIATQATSLGIYAFQEPAARKISVIDHCFTSNLDASIRLPLTESPLVAAALRQDWKVVWGMLDAGASVETANETGVTPLMVAAMQGNIGVLHTLLERHASPDVTDIDGFSALHHALSAGKLEAVQLLLPLVSKVETASTAGQDLLTLALESGDMKIFQTILERFPPTLQWTANTRNALEAALRANMKEQVRLLLSKHPSPPTREGGSVPLIAYAIASDDAPLFRTLLACGSDPNLTIPKAAEKDFMTLLKSKYLRLYIQEETGINLLMLAAGLGKADYVRALLDAGADRNRATPREKMLPLYFAAWTENWQCVQMLLGGGPMPDQLRVEISLAQQNMAVIKDGVTVFTTKVSTGREGFSTKPGRYVITDKDRDHRSTIYKCAMPYFMRLNCRDFGMHEGVVPTYPASHGCIRLPGDAARKLFAEIPVGTVVMIN